MKRLLILAFALGTIVAGVLSGKFIRRFVVQGRSMLRAFEEDDRLLVEGISYVIRKPRVGDVVVVRWPNPLVRPPGTPELDLKRIAAGPGAEVTVQGQLDFLGNDEWYVLGDNMDESTDSRQLGPISTEDIVGRVWRKY